jgi:hypothetical protein
MCRQGLMHRSNKRSAVLPDIPNTDELGLKGFDARDLARAGVIVDLGVDIIGGRPGEFAAYIKSEIPKWSAIVKASGAKLD